MKTFFSRLVIIALALTLVAGLAPAAVTQPASAAVKCVSYHTVKKNDTTVSISKTYDVKWRDIVEANKLKDDYELEVGDRLCIPDLDSLDAPTFTLAARVAAGSVTLTIPKLSENEAFVVKVRDGQTTIGGFTKIGRIKGKKANSVTANFSLPKSLRSKMYIQVCVKNQTSDELICRTVVNLP